MLIPFSFNTPCVREKWILEDPGQGVKEGIRDILDVKNEEDGKGN